jgi:hypothetical protein
MFAFVAQVAHSLSLTPSVTDNASYFPAYCMHACIVHADTAFTNASTTCCHTHVLQGAVPSVTNVAVISDTPATTSALPRPDWEGMARVLDGFRGDMESKSEVYTVYTVYILYIYILYVCTTTTFCVLGVAHISEAGSYVLQYVCVYCILYIRYGLSSVERCVGLIFALLYACLFCSCECCAVVSRGAAR